MGRKASRSPRLFHLRLEHVSSTRHELVSNLLLDGADRVVGDVLELLDDLKRPPPVEQVAPHHVALEKNGQLGVPGSRSIRTASPIWKSR
jgi:hypothetical protein